MELKSILGIPIIFLQTFLSKNDRTNVPTMRSILIIPNHWSLYIINFFLKISIAVTWNNCDNFNFPKIELFQTGIFPNLMETIKILNIFTYVDRKWSIESMIVSMYYEDLFGKLWGITWILRFGTKRNHRSYTFT